LSFSTGSIQESAAISKFQAILSGVGFSPWEFVRSLTAVMVDIASQVDLASDLVSVELTIGPGVKNPPWPVMIEGALNVKSTSNSYDA
jgi:hypothetical protein